MKTSLQMGLGLVVVTLIAFAPAWHGGFIWDDGTYILDNQLLTAPDGLRRIWFSLDSPSQYFPLTFTTFYIERALWGLNPAGYHVVNILLHAANVLLVWRLLTRLRVPGAWLGAVIFALHPVQVESVAWITERKNVLMGFFFLLALWNWVRFLEEEAGRRWRYYIAALICHALALTAKTTACTLPAALLLILWLENKPVRWRQLVHVAPFAVMGIGMGILTIWWERVHQGVHGAAFQMSLLERLLVASRAIWFYAGKLIWPAGLAFSYPRWNISVSDPVAYVWLAASVVLCLLVRLARHWTGRSVETALAFYVLTLSPILGFVMLFTFIYTFVADHYQYLACIGPIALAAAGIELALRRLVVSQAFLRRAVCGVLILTLGALSWRQCENYADLETLWRATIANSPNSWLALNDLGVILYDKGETGDAIALYRRALAVAPRDSDIHNNLGAALEKSGQLAPATIEFQRALALRPNFAEAHRNLGDIFLREGNVNDAIQQFQEAVAIRPDLPRPRFDLATALLREKRVDEAIAQFREELEFHADDAQGHYNLGVLLLQNGHMPEAAAEFEKTVRLRPDFAEARNNLGFALVRQGRLAGAVEQLQAALKIRPDYPEAHYNLGQALLKGGQPDAAVLEFQKLMALQPESIEARQSLSNALAAKARRGDNRKNSVP